MTPNTINLHVDLCSLHCNISGYKYFHNYFSFFLVAVEFCICMLKELMLHLCFQSVWGTFRLPSHILTFIKDVTNDSSWARTDTFLYISTRGEHCGGCRRSNSTERPHAFQVILTERPPLELSANDEQDMAEWMQLLCQSVSKGVRAVCRDDESPPPLPCISSP